MDTTSGSAWDWSGVATSITSAIGDFSTQAIAVFGIGLAIAVGLWGLFKLKGVFFASA